MFFEALLYVLLALVMVGVPVYGWLARGRTYAIFGAVILALSLPGIVIAEWRFESWLPSDWLPWSRVLTILSIASAGCHMAHLVRARLRSRAFRWLVSIPGQVTVASGFMMVIWLLVQLPVQVLFWLLDLESGSEILRRFDIIPFAIAFYSIWTSRYPVEEIVRVRMQSDGPAEFARVPVERHRTSGGPPALDERPLRIVQISDPHLGPWQTVRSLRNTIERLLLHDPDLVLLTGDFLTMESSGTPGALRDALAPLQSRVGSCFAIFGNHDHEAPEMVRNAMNANGIELLVDDEAIVETAIGSVQIVGADFVGRDRRSHLTELLTQFPRREGSFRLLLLHDPLGFRTIEVGEVDLTLSGHTHGGQVGLVSLGRDWTVLSRSRWPDQGLFGLGSNRLYVHRGTGFYGFPMRVGVPGEASLLEIVIEQSG